MLIHNADITGSLTLNGIDISNITGSQSSIIALNEATASLSSSIAILSGSFLTTSASYSSASGSFSQRVTTIEGKYATTGSNFFNGSQTITGSLTVTNQIIAQTLSVQQVTSSIIFSSGSNIFGNSLSNTQQLTGSVRITGSLAVNGTSVPVGSGTSGQVTYWSGTNTQTGNSNLFWDNINTRLGIGLTNPQRRLEVYSATPDSHIRISGDAPSVSMGDSIIGGSYQAKFALVTSNGQYAAGAVAGDFVILSQTGATIFMTSATEKMRVDTSGNLGLGVTPSAWNSTFKVAQLGEGGSFYGRTTGIEQAGMSSNGYFASATNDWRYLATASATSYVQASGVHFWYNAPSGTAGNAITFTQAMTLTANGRLLLGTTTEGTYLLDVNGSARFSETLWITKNQNGVTSINLVNNDLNNAAGQALRFYFNTSTPLGGIFHQYNTTTSAYDLDFKVWSGFSPVTRLFLNGSTGAATFSSSVTANGGVVTTGANGFRDTDGTINAGFYAAYTAGLAGIGTLSNHSFSIFTNGVNERARFTAGGNLLVNSTTDNGNRLQVTGNGYFSGNVGIGVVSATGNLDVFSTSNVYQNISTNGTSASAVLSLYNSTATGDGAAIGYNVAMRFGTITGLNAAGFSEKMRLTSSGNLLVNSTTDNGNRLQVTGNGYFSGSVGIGTANPDGNLVVAAGTNGTASTGGYIGLTTGVNNSKVRGAAIEAFTTDTSNNHGLRFYTNAGATTPSVRMILDSIGNLGLGVQPSAWDAGIKAFEIFSSGNAIVSSTSSQNIITTNARYVGGGWQYGSNGLASTYQQQSGVHTWNLAPSGTAGNAITFTQAMTLTANGRLLLGTTTEGTQLLQVNGTGFFGQTLDALNLRAYNGGSLFLRNPANTFDWAIYHNSSNTINFDFNAANRLTIASTGAATFSSSVTAGGLLDAAGVYSRGDNTNSAPNQMQVTGVANANKQLLIGYNTSGNGYGSIQPVFQGIGYTPLVLNPLGGNCLVGTTTDSGEKLQVAGSANINSGQNIIYSSYDNIGALFQRVGTYGAVVRLGRSGVSNSVTLDYPADGVFAVSTAASERMRIKSDGIINLSNVPSSSAGLSSGDIYKDASGFLKIV